MMRKFNLILGTLLALIGVMGPFTYADDSRHLGELSAMVGILIAGICLLLSALYPKIKTIIGLHRTAVTILAGLIAGTALDLTSYGVLIGIPLGLLIGYLKRNNDASVAT